MQKVVQAGQALTGSQAQKTPVSLVNAAAKERGEHIDRTLGLLKGFTQALQRAQLRRGQIVQPGVQAAKAVVVRGQNQHIVGHFPLELGQGFQPIAHGVGIGFSRVNRHIGGDFGQHLVT